MDILFQKRGKTNALHLINALDNNNEPRTSITHPTKTKVINAEKTQILKGKVKGKSILKTQIIVILIANCGTGLCKLAEVLKKKIS